MAKEDSTTRIKADVSQFKAGIQEATRQIKLANAEFNEASSKLDNWEKSTEGVQAKLTQLSEKEKQQKKILEELKGEYDKVVEVEGESSEGAERLRIQILNQEAVINRTQREIRRYNETLAQLEEESRESSTATNKLKEEISGQEKALEEAKKKYSDLILEQGKGSQEAKDLEKEIERLSKELQENRNKLGEAERAADEFDETLEDVEKESGVVSQGFSVIKGALANLVAQGVQKAVEAFKELATESGKASNSFQAATGASTESMKAYNEEMKELYKNNYGESLEDIAETMAEVKQQTKEIDPSKLKELTKNAIGLRDTFDMDVKESMRAVNSLMNQFGISGTEAFNLIVQGAQDGLNANDDLLDTINEYSVQFKNAGYSADDMLNMIKNGADEGTWSIDKLGDAVKEYNIRMSDGTANEYLKQLGLNADEVTAKFAKGGEDAQSATNTVIAALQQVEDEQQRYTIGQGIMGTMWEDLGENAVYALMNTEGAINKNTEAMENLHNIKYDDVGSKFTELGRSVKEEFIQPIVDMAIPKITELIEYGIENIPKMKEKLTEAKEELDKWLPVITGIGGAIATYFVVTQIASFVSWIKSGTAAIKAMEIAQAALNVVQSISPIGIVIGLIAGLVVAFITLWNKSEEFRNFWIGLWEKIKEAVSGFIDFFKNLPENVKTWFDNTVEKAKEFGESMKEKATDTGKRFIFNIINFIQNLPSKIGYYIGFALGKIIKWSVEMKAKATETGSRFISAVIDFIKTLPEKIWNWLLQTIAKAENFKNDIKKKAKEAGEDFVKKVIEFLANLPQKIQEKFDKGIEKAKEFVTNIGAKGKEAGEELLKKIKEGVSELPTKMSEIGKNIVDGVWNGIKNAKDKFVKDVKDFFGGIVTGAKEALDIHSPSRVMRDQIGKNIALGVAEGIKQNKDNVKKAMQQLAEEAEKEGNISLNLGVSKAKGNVISGTATVANNTTSNTTNNNSTYTFNQYNTSPKALSRLEIYRQTNRQLKLAKEVQ